MKHLLAFLWVLSLASTPLLAGDAPAGGSPENGSAKTRSEQEILALLKKTVIPRVTFSGTSLERGLRSLEEMANAKLPEGERISILLIDPAPRQKLNFSVRNLSVDRILDIISHQTGYQWEIKGGKVLLRSSVSKGNVSTRTAVLEMKMRTSDAFAAPGGSVGSAPAMAPPTAASLPGGFRRDFNTESYDIIRENPFRSPRIAPLSTFSIDVDTASYSNLRRMILRDQKPPPDAIRIEELINYFPYDYPEPKATAEVPERITPSNLPDFLEHPVAIETEVGPAPWNPDHRLLRIALKGFEIDWERRPPANLVFLLDVSGSMKQTNKLPLVKESLRLLVERLGPDDRVAIVVYAGASGLVLPSTTANNTETILHAIDNLQAGGSTNAGAGIELAYETAKEQFIGNGVNRVILCTDGDFNVGVTDKGSLVEMAGGYADEGVRLTILGFGMGNYKDDMLEALTNAADGNYAYIDGPLEARRLFLQAASGSLITIAKDVKIQVEFNPAVVQAYRLIGYENRLLNPEDFNDDTKDAGELGAGQTVTALYEIVPPGADIELPEVDELKYQVSAPGDSPPSGKDWVGMELATVKLRYKWPQGEQSEKMEIPATLPADQSIAAMGADYRLSAALATWGMLLRDSEFTAPRDWTFVEEVANEQLADPGATELKTQWAELVSRSRTVTGR